MALHKTQIQVFESLPITRLCGLRPLATARRVVRLSTSPGQLSHVKSVSFLAHPNQGFLSYYSTQFILPYRFVTAKISSNSSSERSSSVSLHLQFVPTVDGLFVRQSLLSPI